VASACRGPVAEGARSGCPCGQGAGDTTPQAQYGIEHLGKDVGELILSPEGKTRELSMHRIFGTSYSPGPLPIGLV
jgi:hypothetical protein